MQEFEFNNSTAKNIWLSFSDFALANFEANAPIDAQSEATVKDALAYYNNKTRQASNANPVVLLPEPTKN